MDKLLWLIVAIGAAGWWIRDRRKRPIDHWDARPLPPSAGEYLDRLDAALGLPADLRAEVRAELSDHLSDSIGALEAEGLDEDAATREALARLGRPDEMARQMRAAHQTTRRLLAGAAGGVYQAGVSMMQGYLIGFVGLFLLIMLVVPLRPWLGFVDDALKALQDLGNDGMDASSAAGALVAAFAAFMAGRQSVRAVASLSARPTGSIAPYWALAGVLVVGWISVFMVTAYQSWLAVLPEIAIPFAFAAGALVRPDSNIVVVPSRVWWLAAAALLILPLGLFAVSTHSTSTVEPVQTGGYQWNSSDLDDVAPAWPSFVASIQADTYSVPSVVMWLMPGETPTLDQFHDVRIDLWRGMPWQGDAPADAAPTRPDFSAGAPYRSIAVPNRYGQRFDLKLTSSRNYRWFPILTGVAPDGVRYRLDYGEPAGFTTRFSGTVWDWLTATD